MKFFGSEMTPPPLSEIFRKFIRFRGDRLPLNFNVKSDNFMAQLIKYFILIFSVSSWCTVLRKTTYNALHMASNNNN